MKRGRGWSECRIADLPEDILIDILSRLSIKTIVTCRCVSKTWCNLLSSSNRQFTKLHFNRSPVQFIHETNKDNRSATDNYFYIHLVELQDDTNLDRIKRLPSKFGLSSFSLFAVNSCNGFLCLTTTMSLANPVKVCNPVTGEYLNLPKHKTDDYMDVASGFGCSAKTNQYKVVKLVICKKSNPVLGYRKGDAMAVVYTIGTQSWRNIGTAPRFSSPLGTTGSTTFFNGAIHWVYYNSSDFIISFDLESEKFGVVPPPSNFSAETITVRNSTNIGVLGDFLYLSHHRELWVMKEYGVQESWTKMYVVDRRSVYSHQPIKYLSGGKILMNDSEMNLISYDLVEKLCKEFKHPQFQYRFRTIAHVPSFMSFNDAMMRDKSAKLRTRMCRVRIEGRH